MDERERAEVDPGAAAPPAVPVAAPVAGPPPPPNLAPPVYAPPPPASALPPGIPAPTGAYGGPALDGAAPALWYQLSGFVKALAVLFACAGVAAAAVSVGIGLRLSAISALRSGDTTAEVLHRGRLGDDIVSVAGTVLGIVVTVTAVVLIVWLFRAAKNNLALGRTNPRFGPGWAIGGWFLPIGNLFIPLMLVQDLWRGADPSVLRDDPAWRRARGSGLVRVWWGFWVLAELRFVVTRGNEAPTPAALHRDNVIALVFVLMVIPAAVLAAQVVRSLTERQERCRAAQWRGWA